jgi:hypothetical protein
MRQPINADIGAISKLAASTPLPASPARQRWPNLHQQPLQSLDFPSQNRSTARRDPIRSPPFLVRTSHFVYPTVSTHPVKAPVQIRRIQQNPGPRTLFHRLDQAVSVEWRLREHGQDHQIPRRERQWSDVHGPVDFRRYL